jgi:hypothetical protein
LSPLEQVLPSNGVDDVLREVVSGHLGALLAHYLELEFLHGLLESVEGLGFDVPKLLEGLMVRVEGKGVAA